MIGVDSARGRLDGTIALVVLLILVQVGLRFSGIGESWAAPLNYLNNSEKFPLDMFAGQSFYKDTSLFFALNKFLRVEQNDWAALALYLAACATTIYFTYQILTRFFSVKDASTALFLVLLLIFVDRKIPLHNWSGVIPVINGFSGVIGHALAFSIIYFILRNRIGVAAVLLTVMLSFHVKANFVLGPILFFYVLFNRAIPNINLGWLVLPGSFVLFKLFTSVSMDATPEDLHLLYELALRYEGQDSVFLREGWHTIALLVLSFVIYPFLYRHFDKNVRSYGLAVLITAAFTMAIAILYTSYGYQYWPNPMLLMLGPIRAFKFYTFLFYVMSFVLILHSDRLTRIEKLFSMMALITFHANSWGGIIYPAFLLAVGVLAPRSIGLLSDRKVPGASPLKAALDYVNGLRLEAVGCALIILLVGFQMWRGGVYGAHRDFSEYRYINRWTMGLAADQATWEAYLAMAQKEKSRDFLLFPLYLRKGTYAWMYYWNMITEKSPFMEEGLHFYFNARLARWYKTHRSMGDRLLRSLNTGQKIPDDVIEYLTKMNAHVMIPADVRDLFSNVTGEKTYQTFRLLEFGTANQTRNLLTSDGPT